MNRLLITKQEQPKQKIITALFEEKDLVEVTLSALEDQVRLGNIYLGKVKNIIHNINGAFVEIENGIICYLSLENSPFAVFANKKNTNKLCIGDEIIVQVCREPVKTKAPVVTCAFSLTGKYTVLTHGKTGIGISSKINDPIHKKRLREFAESYSNEQWGLILRTNAVQVSEEELSEEISQLKSQYQTLLQRGIHRSRFSLLLKSPAPYLCDIRDSYMTWVDEIVTDDPILRDEIIQYLNAFPSELTKFRFYQDPMLSLSNLYGLEAKLSKAISSKVWLNSGGYLVIEPTEALTVIDVNTGKAISGKKKAEETFFRINKEAALAIARQLRLRNLSGIIIVDFIDMKEAAYRKELMELLEGEFQKDPIKTTLVDMTALNLVEITRKKKKKPLHEQIKEFHSN